LSGILVKNEIAFDGRLTERHGIQLGRVNEGVLIANCDAIAGRRGQNDHASEEDRIMRIDIDELSESELIDLNNRIVQRLRFLRQKGAHEQMLKFKIGDRVTFHPEGRPPVVGMLTRYNRKTVTVITDDGQQWNVSPSLLRNAVPESTEVTGTKVVPLRRD
jgi:hypothetical protein